MLAKSKFSIIEALISKPLIDSVIEHNKFVIANDVGKDYNDMKN